MLRGVNREQFHWFYKVQNTLLIALQTHGTFLGQLWLWYRVSTELIQTRDCVIVLYVLSPFCGKSSWMWDSALSITSSKWTKKTHMHTSIVRAYQALPSVAGGAGIVIHALIKKKITVSTTWVLPFLFPPLLLGLTHPFHSRTEHKNFVILSYKLYQPTIVYPIIDLQ